MKVAELARLEKTTLETVRHYTRLGLLNPKRNPENGYRIYDHSDRMRLSFILKARSLGFTLSDIEAIIADSDSGHSPCEHVRTLIESRLQQVEKEIKELQMLSHRMRSAMHQWEQQPNCAPDEETVCGLISSFADNQEEFKS